MNTPSRVSRNTCFVYQVHGFDWQFAARCRKRLAVRLYDWCALILSLAIGWSHILPSCHPHCCRIWLQWVFLASVSWTLDKAQHCQSSHSHMRYASCSLGTHAQLTEWQFRQIEYIWVGDHFCRGDHFLNVAIEQALDTCVYTVYSRTYLCRLQDSIIEPIVGNIQTRYSGICAVMYVDPLQRIICLLICSLGFSLSVCSKLQCLSSLS